jgi:hypothetical protein
MYRQRVIGLLSVSLLFLAACGRSTASLETLPLTEEQASYVRQYAKPPASGRFWGLSIMIVSPVTVLIS